MRFARRESAAARYGFYTSIVELFLGVALSLNDVRHGSSRALSEIKELCPWIAVHSFRHGDGTLPWLASNGSPAECIPSEIIQEMQQLAEETIMSNGKSAGEKDYAALEADFDRLREDVASLTETVKKVAANEARGMADAMRDGIDGAAERVRKAGKRAKNSAQDAAESLQTSVEEHPIQSVLLALGLGVVVGMLLRR